MINDKALADRGVRDVMAVLLERSGIPFSDVVLNSPANPWVNMQAVFHAAECGGWSLKANAQPYMKTVLLLGTGLAVATYEEGLMVDGATCFCGKLTTKLRVAGSLEVAIALAFNSGLIDMRKALYILKKPW